MGTSKKQVAKVPAPKKEVKVKKASSVRFESFSVTAVIPVMSYGNIQPKIEVKAASYEDAKAFVMPLIAELFKEYGEAKPTFLGKVTETVKEVAPIAAPAPAPAPVAPQAQDTPAPVAQDVPAAPATAQAPVAAPKSEFAARAEKMIGLAMTEEAAQKIKDQIEKSEKIPAAEKPALLELVQDKLIKLSAEAAF